VTPHPAAQTADKTAETRVPLHPLLAERWSPRAFDAAHEVGDEDLDALLEAARWAPSSGNTQPWRFLVARRGEPAFDRLAALLMPGNRTWAASAGALVLAAAQTVDETGRDRPWALYDTGQAVAALTIQAQHEGLAVHQMGGFDAEATRDTFSLPDSIQPVVVVAVGRRDPRADLPEPLATRERAPRTREPLEALLISPGSSRRAA
jgi:nitroreductase